MTLRCQLFMFILATFCSVCIAKLDLCNEFLDPNRYELATRASPDSDVSVFTRKPEPESLEERRPGIAKSILELMRFEHVPLFFRRDSVVSGQKSLRTIEDLSLLGPTLLQIPKRFNLTEQDAQRFMSVAADIAKLTKEAAHLYFLSPYNAATITTAVNETEGRLFELVVSTFFEGSHFVFHQTAIAHYGDQTPKTKGGTIIDVIVKKDDGHDLWLMVKNNAFDWSEQEYKSWAHENGISFNPTIHDVHARFVTSRRFLSPPRSIGPQLRQQILARSRLGLSNRVEILVITRYELPDYVYTAIKRQDVSSWPLYLTASPLKPDYFKRLTETLAAN